MKSCKRVCSASVARCCFVAAIALTVRAEAQVTSAAILKTADYSQSTDNVVGTFQDVRAQPALFTTNPGDITAASVTFPGAISTRNLTQNGTSWGIPSDDFYSSLSAADAAYPNGTYTFGTSGGTAGTTTRTVDLEGSYPREPIFTGTSLADLASKDPAGPITVTFNGFTRGPSENAADAEIVLVGGPSVFQFFDPGLGATQFTFPAGTFQPDTNYSLNLEYIGDNQDGNGDESNYSSFTQASVLTAAAVPEPVSAGLLALGSCLMLTIRRRRA